MSDFKWKVMLGYRAKKSPKERGLKRHRERGVTLGGTARGKAYYTTVFLNWIRVQKTITFRHKGLLWQMHR